MTRGYLYVIFGEDYLIPAHESIKYLKKVTNYPICVITNIKNLDLDVDCITTLNMNTDENRIVRTQAINYSPFGQTLMIDVDSIPISRKIHSLFENLNTYDFGFQKVKEYTNQVARIYGYTMYKTQTTTPLTAYSGGVIFFNKSEKCVNFFNLWHKYWGITGSGRDMPSLACAIKNSPNITFFQVDHCIDREITVDTIIFHAYGEHDKTVIPTFKKNKPFDERGDLFEMIPVRENQILTYNPLEY